MKSISTRAGLGLNKACDDLHSRKTWSDVKINVEMKMEKKCKSREGGVMPPVSDSFS